MLNINIVYFIIFKWNIEHYPDSEPTSLYSYSLILRDKPISNKYHFHSLWFDPTGARTRCDSKSIDRNYLEIYINVFYIHCFALNILFHVIHSYSKIPASCVNFQGFLLDCKVHNRKLYGNCIM
jgi:hypothetical protein